MFRKFNIVTVLLLLSVFQCIDSLQCYKCGCFVKPGETTCLEESELNCVIQYVENSYCYILRKAGDIEFGHNSNSDLIFLESLHYIRATEEFSYSTQTSSWAEPKVTQVSYGCNWNLCNSPRILNLLPTGLSFAVSTKLLSDLFIPAPTESFSTCLSCVTCVNSTAAINCPPTSCSGSCLIDDHIDDPGFNDGSCAIVFESNCAGSEQVPTTVHIRGNYYLDYNNSDITEIDVYCRKNNCNSLSNIQAVQANTAITTQLNNQLFFRPNVIATTPTTPNNQLLECFECRCTQEPDSNSCQFPDCTTVFRNASYCQIVRDRTESSDLEIITLGHTAKASAPYPHYIYAVEELELYTNLTWSSPSVNLITYVCDWPLCNDPRIVGKLKTSFQFREDPTEIAPYIQGPAPLSSCLRCDICSNKTEDLSQCQPVSCGPDAYCFIEQYIDDPQYDDCEFAFKADCEPDTPGSSMTIGAIYNIDDDLFEVEQFDLYCSLNNCNNVTTVNILRSLLLEDISLDPLFFFRPANGTASSTTTTTTTTTAGTDRNHIAALVYLVVSFSLWFINQL